MGRKIYTSKARHLLHGGDYNPDQWLDVPDVLQDDLRLMRLAHTNTYSVGIFAWSALEPTENQFTFEWLDQIIDDIDANGGRVILATPSGARPAWLSQAYPEVLRVDERRVKQLHGGRHNHCLTSPVYRKKTQQINRLLAERYGNHPALLMWHVSNEYGGDCHCPLCQEAFRDWLKVKYETLEALNASWWSAFWSHTFDDWSQIESPSPIGESMVHGLNLDWKRFVTDQTISFFEQESVPLRELTPALPITTNFMADTEDLIPFQALDYSRFAKHVDVVSWDAYPTWHNDWETTANLALKVGFINDLFRSLKQQPFLLMESTPSAVNWHPVNKAKRPGMHLLSSLQMIAHGSDSVLYFQWRKSRGSSEKFHGAVVDHDRSEQNRVFQEVAQVGRTLEQLDAVVGTTRPAEVGILYDWENNWALNDAQGFANDTKQYPQTLQEHYRFFYEQDIPVDVITKEQPFDAYKLLIVPMLYLVSATILERLQRFVEQGGTLVTTYMTGLVDEHDLAYTGWPEELQTIFGLTPAETDTLYPSDRNHVMFNGKQYELQEYATVIQVDEAEVVGRYTDDFYRQTPAVTKHRLGQGEAWYIGGRLEAAFQRDLYTLLTDRLRIEAPLATSHRAEVSVQVRRGQEKDYGFILNFSEIEQSIELFEPLLESATQTEISSQLILAPYEVKIVERKNRDQI
ncbi:beta-galactosidase [Exiguobacterium sp. Helios]|uniref:beta-galactosidase n=1 Tax=Exiguobacterium sp. Helios TaxID=2735868 RepID=UPI00165E8783|nr:beta-galactosidase [Exiguobacterium sp. Helios]QNR21260.1 beta-galactosidase [Exiguobacterium sp. Helios]